jgi:hypothetical protein
MSGWAQRFAAIAEDRAARRREAVAEEMREAGVEVAVEGEAVRLTGRGLMRRWVDDLSLREAGRGGL